MKFGLLVSSTPRGGTLEEMMEADDRIARAASDHGLSLWFIDHLQFDDRPILEAFAHLTHTSARYPGVAVGNVVLCQSFRNPAHLAKIAATLQFLTGGKFILGIGAGWKEDEYKAYGYPYPTAGQRLDELGEALEIITRMWSGEPVTFSGKYHKVEAAICQPAPNPRPTIMIGGGGEQLTLRLAAKHADWWNFDHHGPEDFGRKLAVLADRCHEIGRDPATILPSSYNICSLSRDPARIEHEALPPFQPGIHVVAGTPEAFIDQIRRYEEAGAEMMILNFLDYLTGEGLNCFLEDVLPQFQQ